MPTGVYTRTPEYREKIRKIALERGYGKWMQGKKQSEECKEKKRQACYGRKEKFGYYHTVKGLQRMIEGSSKPKRNFVCPNCDKKFSDNTDRKFCSRFCASTFRRGENAGNWRGGLRSERETAMGRVEYKSWRKAVFKRDDYTCQRCYIRGGKLHAHHIESWASHVDLRYSTDNGLTLCVPCHRIGHRKNAA